MLEKKRQQSISHYTCINLLQLSIRSVNFYKGFFSLIFYRLLYLHYMYMYCLLKSGQTKSISNLTTRRLIEIRYQLYYSSVHGFVFSRVTYKLNQIFPEKTPGSWFAHHITSRKEGKGNIERTE